ncbi:hypothetical protein [Mucilaginibacter sp. OK283]|jgi:hypothetical protein|uniref:hypothetical protein n=1 Tax=Mucilaginibacter sp. OK283 TaxID=1881049 RepID=UPI0008C794DF|nr:hypothetical protein [Mucilaginibacter sp. OK283]SEO57894.1 hypothetical protein SAMN05428947_1036 [Mucilaginibacter sp. OK283]
MDMPTTYISSPDYVNSLTFDYIETYSFQRGGDYQVRLNVILPELEALKTRSESETLTSGEAERYTHLNNVYHKVGSYIINEDGQFHQSAIKTNTFKRESPEVDRLITILNIPAVNIPYWMCAPVYRDAVVFYDKDGNIISTLNVCLGCEYMAIQPSEEIHTDAEAYRLIKQFFIDLGHQVQDDYPTAT